MSKSGPTLLIETIRDSSELLLDLSGIVGEYLRFDHIWKLSQENDRGGEIIKSGESMKPIPPCSWAMYQFTVVEVPLDDTDYDPSYRLEFGLFTKSGEDIYWECTDGDLDVNGVYKPFSPSPNFGDRVSLHIDFTGEKGTFHIGVNNNKPELVSADIDISKEWIPYYRALDDMDCEVVREIKSLI